jgi:ketosteroid isomerase-like protein
MFKKYAFKFASTLLETQVAGDWAYVRGNYIDENRHPKSGEAMEDSGKYLLIAKRQPDGPWKVYRLIWNSNNPPPSAAGKKK